MKRFSALPSAFWILLILSLVGGFISLVVLRTHEHIEQGNIKSDYPLYTHTIQAFPDVQAALYKKMKGAWYINKDTTEIIMEFYDDGYFTWESVDSAARYIKLFAAGRYALDGQGRLLFSQMRELGLPFDQFNPSVSIQHFALGETLFPFQIKKEQAHHPKILILQIPQSEDAINPAVSIFLKTLSGNERAIALKYLGTPTDRAIK